MRLRSERWHAMYTRFYVAVTLVTLMLTASACNFPTISAQANSTTLSVHVVRTSAIPQNNIPAFERTVTDPTKAEALYAALYALPPFPKEEYFCPMDTGLAYQLTFTRGRTVVTTASVKPDGCEAVILPHGDVRWAMSQSHFWATFTATVGISQTDLYPSRTTSGPFAPTPTQGG